MLLFLLFLLASEVRSNSFLEAFRKDQLSRKRFIFFGLLKDLSSAWLQRVELVDDRKLLFLLKNYLLFPIWEFPLMQNYDKLLNFMSYNI